MVCEVVELCKRCRWQIYLNLLQYVDHHDLEHDEHDDEATKQECIEKFSIPDFIMEPEVFVTLQRYMRYVLQQ